MTRFQSAALAWVLIVLGVLAVHVFVPQRSGPFALSEVLEPYIALTGLVAGVVAFRADTRFARVVVVVFLVLVTARCVPGSVSSPGPSIGTPLGVMAWNLEAGPEAGERALAGLLKTEARLVGLEELQPAAASAVAADPTLASRMPFRVLAPEPTVLGMGLLSAYPILEHQSYTDPPLIRAIVDPELGEPFAVFVVHPLPARIQSFVRIPVALDTTDRDADIRMIRSIIDQDLAAGRSVVVLGDINTTEREPAYAELSAGLRDAHLDAGVGPGFTWRPPDIAFLPFGMLRIDYIFVSTPFVVGSTFTDCTASSDHCRLEATIYLGTQL